MRRVLTVLKAELDYFVQPEGHTKWDYIIVTEVLVIALLVVAICIALPK